MQSEGEREELRRELHVLARMLHSEDTDVSSRASRSIKDMVLASNPAQVILECVRATARRPAFARRLLNVQHVHCAAPEPGPHC